MAVAFPSWERSAWTTSPSRWATTDVAVGDPATLIGADGDERVTAEELARTLDTINYEITCGVSARVPRVHLAP